MAMAVLSLRREATGVRGRKWYAHLDGSSALSGSERGESLRQGTQEHRGKNTTLIASMSLSGMGESMCVEGATDAEVFEVYVKYFLAPTLSEGQA